jgi:hypothetical protein
VQFIIGDPGAINNVADLVRYVRGFEERAAAAIGLLAAGHIDMSYALPDKPRNGDLLYADGVQCDPGAGFGLYIYNGPLGAWHKLG